MGMGIIIIVILVVIGYLCWWMLALHRLYAHIAIDP